MKDFLSRTFRVRPGETGLVLILGFLLLSNSLAMQVSGIVAISGFLSAGGVNQILIVWVIDTLLIILMTGLQSLIVDRFDRITLMRWMTFGFALVFTVLRLMFTFQAPGWLNYSLLYLVSQQQWLLFPLVFWILANDIFDMPQTIRLFPLIASWGSAGKLLGIGIALLSPSLFGQLAIKSEEVLTVNVLVYLLAYLLMQGGLGKVKVRQTRQKRETLRELLTEGWAFVREVPSFRFLSVSILALLVCETIVEFRFLVVSDTMFSDPGRYQIFYSLYRLGVTLAAFVIQGLLTSRIIAYVNLKNAFFIKPFCVLLGILWMIVQPGLVGGVGGMVMLALSHITVDESSRKAFQALVPEERRGRVSIFMDSYLYSVGAIVGCLITGVIVLVGSRSGSPTYFYVYLGVAVSAALLALWAIFKMRAAYDVSLLNWRLKRRQRGKSVLDGLEF